MRILLVDDDPGDVVIVQEALAECSPHSAVRVVYDGVEAVEFLSGCALEELPDLVLLDLNMPRMNGRETLAVLKTDDRTRHIPVVVLTTSAAHEDVLGSYREHANAYVNKPVELEQFVAAVEKIETFYERVAALPSQTRLA